MLIRLREAMLAFRRDHKGVAAVEFAIILPLMLIFFIGVVETATALTANRKTTAVASTVADLAAQAITLSDSDIFDIFGAARSIMQPHGSNDIQIRLTSASDSGGGNVSVDWSEGYNMAPYSQGQSVNVPPDIVFTNGSVIIAEVRYTYQSAFTYYAYGDIAMEDKFYARPRRTLVVGRTR